MWRKMNSNLYLTWYKHYLRSTENINVQVKIIKPSEENIYEGEKICLYTFGVSKHFKI